MLTIREFAKELNLSPATISLAMSNDSRISLKTQTLVRRKAEELGYIPNAMARAMFLKKSNIIGIIVPDMTIFFPPILEGIHERLQASGLHSMVYVSHNQKEIEYTLTLKLLEFKVDGIIIASIFEKYTDAPHLQKIKRFDIPVVAFNTKPNDFECDFVTSDDYSGAIEAVEELINLGHRRIAHLAGAQYFSGYRHRLEGYIEVLRRRGVNYEQYSRMIRVLDESNEEESVFEVMDEFRKKGMPTSLFCKSDHAAASVIRWADRNAVKIPQDLSLIGCGNTPMCRWLSPALTSVSAECEGQASRIVDVLSNRIDNPNEPVKEHLVAVKLVRRESCQHV